MKDLEGNYSVPLIIEEGLGGGFIRKKALQHPVYKGGSDRLPWKYFFFTS